MDGFIYIFVLNFFNYLVIVGFVFLDFVEVFEELFGLSLNVVKDIMSMYVLSSGESGSICDYVIRVSIVLY